MRKAQLNRLIVIIILLIVVSGIYMFNKNGLFQSTTNKSSETSLLQDNLIELSEWTTLKYEYSNVIVSRTERSLSLLGVTEINYAEAIKLIEIGRAHV